MKEKYENLHLDGYSCPFLHSLQKKRDCADWNSLVKNDEMCLCLRFSSDSLISSDGNHLVDVVN